MDKHFILKVDNFIQIGNTFGSLQDPRPTPEEGEASPNIYTTEVDTLE